MDIDEALKILDDDDSFPMFDCIGMEVFEAIDTVCTEVRQLREENTRLEVLSQQTHGAHSSWVSAAQERNHLARQLAELQAIYDRLCK